MTRTVDGKCWIWLVLIVALVLRLGLAFGVQQIVSRTPGRLCLIAGDAEGYWELAGKVASGEDYSIFDPPRYLLRMPGFPLLLAIPRLLFHSNPFPARIMLALIGTFACGLVYYLGRELVSHFVGLVASAYVAVSPTMALFSVLFLSETAFAAAMVASLIVAARLVRLESSTTSRWSHRVAMATLTGVLVALATYMRPTWILAAPGFSVALLILGRSPLKTRAALAGLLCAGCALALAPWTIRNFQVTGHVIPTTLWVGPSLYDGLNPSATGDSDMLFFEQDQLLAKMSEYDMDREYRRRAWEFAAANPARVCWLAYQKQLRFWNPTANAAQFDDWRVRVIGWSAFVPLYGLAVLGAWFGRRDLWLLTLTATPVLYFAGLHLLFVGSLRYRLPAEYPLAVLAGFGLSRFPGWDRSLTTACRFGSTRET